MLGQYYNANTVRIEGQKRDETKGSVGSGLWTVWQITVGQTRGDI